jgi:elongation factor G
MDRVGSDFKNCIKEINEKLNKKACAIQLPIGKESEFCGIIDLVEQRAIFWKDDDQGISQKITEIPKEYLTEADSAREELIECLADFDNELAELYLEGKNIDNGLIKEQIRKLVIDNEFVPVLCGSAFKNKGIQPLLDAVIEFLPSPIDRGNIDGISGKNKNNKASRRPSEEESFSGLAFKIASDPFVGALTFFRIYSGQLSVGQNVYNPLSKKRERVSKILVMHANKREEVQNVSAGQIVALTGLKGIKTGQTLCAENNPIIFDLMEFPETVISLAIEPKTSADEKKLYLTLAQLELEDPSFTFKENKETGQLLIYGMGELHLDIIVDRITRNFSVGIRVGKPQVSYREGVLNSAESEASYEIEAGGKKQSGHCKLRVEPIDKSNGISFETSLNKRNLPLTFIESIKKGVMESAPGGVVAGYALSNLKITLVSANFDEEEANEVAYKVAASNCLRKACLKAQISILEPIMKLEVSTPPDFTGDVISDINGKRGKIINIGAKNNKDIVDGEVPLAELFGYSTALRSKTQGRGNFSMSFEKYISLPSHLEKKFFESRGISIGPN